jgi:hypothetical protein
MAAQQPCVIANFAQMDCFGQAQAIYNAYTTALMGGQRVRIQYDNHFVEYRPSTPADLSMLRDLYMQIRNGCQQAQCLPDLSPGSRVRRGPAIYGIIGRG